MVLRVSLLGELSITGDLDPGTVQVRASRVRSARAVALVGFLVVHAGSPQPGTASRACSGRSPVMRRRSPTCAASCTTCVRCSATILRSW